MPESKPSITFLTGTSASGKTTVYEKLKQDTDFEKFSLHDIDENGVPPVGRGAWREYRVQQLLFDAANLHKEGTSTIICGISFPHEVIESDYYSPDLSIKFIVVEAMEDAIRERLLERRDQQLKTDVYDESFDDSNIEKTIRENIDLRRRLHNFALALAQGRIVDTSSLSIDEMYSEAKTIILTDTVTK